MRSQICPHCKIIKEIDKQKFIDTGTKFIYELDQYPRSSVKKQIAKEFDEILELNDPGILQKRSEYFGVGKATDYLNKVIKTKEGDVVAGIRHLGGDKNKPFVFVWPSFQIFSIRQLAEDIRPHFEIFNPDCYSYWSRPDCNKSNEQVFQQKFVGRIDDMIKNSAPLRRLENYYEWYKSEYAKFHREKPEYVNRVSINSKETMDKSLNDNLLFFYVQYENKIGLIAGETDIFLEKPAIYLNEILISQNHRGKGYATMLLASFTRILDAEYFICDIDSDNIPSTKTAFRSGQKPFSQEIFVQV